MLNSAAGYIIPLKEPRLETKQQSLWVLGTGDTETMTATASIVSPGLSSV